MPRIQGSGQCAAASGGGRSLVVPSPAGSLDSGEMMVGVGVSGAW